LYQAKFNKNDCYTIGFSFDYVNEKYPTIKVSIKEGLDNPLFFNGSELNMDNFKILFKETIKFLKENKKENIKEVLDVFKNIFQLMPEYNIKVKKLK
jgi:hypothetical protein